MTEAVLLVGHGSRDPEGSHEFEEMAAAIRQRVGERLPLYHGFLEFARPTIAQGIAQAVGDGATTLYAVPVLLLDAGHAIHDIPHALAEGVRPYAGVKISYGDHLGFHPGMMSAVVNALKEAGEEPEASHPGRGLLLVGRGSSDPVANSNFYKFSRMLWERTGYEVVENAFIGLTQPSLPQGLARCRALGLKSVVVVPYFLFTGALYKRIVHIAEEFFADNPSMSGRVTRYFGLQEVVLNAVTDRVEDLLASRRRPYDDEWMRTGGVRYATAAGGHAHSHHHHRGAHSHGLLSHFHEDGARG